MDDWTRELEKVRRYFNIFRRARMTHVGDFRIPKDREEEVISDYFMSFNNFAGVLRVVEMHNQSRKNNKHKQKINDLMNHCRKKGSCRKSSINSNNRRKGVAPMFAVHHQKYCTYSSNQMFHKKINSVAVMDSSLTMVAVF